MNDRDTIELRVEKRLPVDPTPVGDRQALPSPTIMKADQTLTYSDCTAQFDNAQTSNVIFITEAGHDTTSVTKVKIWRLFGSQVLPTVVDRYDVIDLLKKGHLVYTVIVDRFGTLHHAKVTQYPPDKENFITTPVLCSSKSPSQKATVSGCRINSRIDVHSLRGCKMFLI